MFATEQPNSTPTLSAVQMEYTPRKLDPSMYKEALRGLSISSNRVCHRYEVFKITPSRFYVPAIENGVNAATKSKWADLGGHECLVMLRFQRLKECVRWSIELGTLNFLGGV